jgi:hypothetical protein
MKQCHFHNNNCHSKILKAQQKLILKSKSSKIWSQKLMSSTFIYILSTMYSINDINNNILLK